MAWMRFRKREMPGGLWSKCSSCGEMLFQKDLEQNFKICPKCAHHLPLSVADRVQLTLDDDSFEELDAGMTTVDALEFTDSGPYTEKLVKNREKTGRNEAMVIGTGRLRDRPLVFGALEFNFLGGSMGVVVGEKVARAAEYAAEHKLPLLLFSASGGARMHEGALSLMQMAKSCAALARLHEKGGLYVSVLAHPTTGGVTASWATMADIVLAEPKALIGFAGPRVIKNTIRQDLPKGFQTSEFLLEKGQLDRIVERPAIVEELDRIFHYCLGPVPKRKKKRSKESSAPAEKKAEKKADAKNSASSGGSPVDAASGGRRKSSAKTSRGSASKKGKAVSPAASGEKSAEGQA